jgi:hypothetical protein
LICEEESDAVAAKLELVQQVECGLGRIARQHTILGAIVRTEVAINGAQNVCVVIDRE